MSKIDQPKSLRPCCITRVFDSRGYFKKSKFKQLHATTLVGLAGLQNLEIAAKFQDSLSHLVLFDFDENLVGENGFWSVFRQAIVTSETKESFLENLQSLLIRNKIFDINAIHSKQILDETCRTNPELALKQSAELIIAEIKKMDWFKSASKFDFIKNLFAKKDENFEAQGGVKITSADLTKEEDLTKLVSLCSDPDYPAKARESVLIHLSNSLDFVLGRGYSNWKTSGGPAQEDIRFSQTSKNAGILLSHFLKPLEGRNVHIIDSVYTHNTTIHPISTPGEGHIDIPIKGHFHSAVVTPEQLIGYRFTSKDPGAINPETFKKAASKISGTCDIIDERIKARPVPSSAEATSLAIRSKNNSSFV